jgi:hypothetical protein
VCLANSLGRVEGWDRGLSCGTDHYALRTTNAVGDCRNRRATGGIIPILNGRIFIVATDANDAVMPLGIFGSYPILIYRGLIKGGVAALARLISADGQLVNIARAI